MQGSPRISVRLETDTHERLQKHCAATACDVSFVVREALTALLSSQPGQSNGGVPPKRLAPPQEIEPYVPQYLGWANGDLREKRKELCLDLIAASFVCRKHYPQTKGMQESYLGLLQLCPYFGID
jgi:hypothetical protein